MSAVCGYCGGSGWAPGCGDQTCCPPGQCASCDGTGTPKERSRELDDFRIDNPEAGA